MSMMLESGRERATREPNAGFRTLLVDDDPDLLEITGEMLALAGCDVTTAEHPMDAMALIRNGQTFDLLFTDYRFPGFVTGVELANEAVAHLPGLKVILATGFDAKTIEDQVKPEYVHLAKPFSVATLKETIAALFPAN